MVVRRDGWPIAVRYLSNGCRMSISPIEDQITCGTMWRSHFYLFGPSTLLASFLPLFLLSLLPSFLSSTRWVKFEEDVEEGGERWSKPHVATLSLHSLFELRNCLMNHSVLLDVEVSSMDDVVQQIVNQPVYSYLTEEQKTKVSQLICLQLSYIRTKGQGMSISLSTVILQKNKRPRYVN